MKKSLAAVMAKMRAIHHSVQKRKAIYDPESGQIELWYETDRHIMPADFVSLRDEIASFSGPQVSVRISQCRFAQDVFSDRAALTKCVKDCCVVHAPMILPFISRASVALNENRLQVGIPGEEGLGIFSHLGLAEVLREYLQSSYGVVVQVKAEADYDTEEDRYDAPSVVVPHARLVDDARPVAREKQQPLAVPVPRRRQKTLPDVIRVDELREGTRSAIDVHVVSVEQRKSKGGDLTIYTMCVTDYTGSVTALAFSRDSHPLTPVPKPGEWIRLEGKYELDSYSHDHVFRISEVMPSCHVERIDDADIKRVELHAHTKMSAMDAITDVSALVSKASQWGHDAIAITDHGVTQAFPAAAAAAGNGIKIIYGCEAYMFDDVTTPWAGEGDGVFDMDFVVIDLKTTGMSPIGAEIIEIGAASIEGGHVADTFHSYVASHDTIAARITQLTGITDKMLEGAPSEEAALQSLCEFCAGRPVAAYESMFVTGFLSARGRLYGIDFSAQTLNILRLAQASVPEAAGYKIEKLAVALGIPWSPQGAEDSAVCAAHIMLTCFERLRKAGIETLRDTAPLLDPRNLYRSTKTNHIILLCRDKKGVTELNRLVSHAHIEYLYGKKPRFPRSEIQAAREHLIIGSACENGDLYQAALAGQSDAALERIADFYDYLEIQPVANNRFMIETGLLPDDDAIRTLNCRIVDLGTRLGIPVAATCDVHFLEPHDASFREVLQATMGYRKAEQPPLFLRTTKEMLGEFAYLGAEKSQEVVVEVPRAISDLVERFDLLPSETAMPVLDGAAEAVENMSYEKARMIYGQSLPEIIETRLKRELNSIIGHGFSVLYYSAHKLVRQSNEDGYLVGSRGSVGSSLTAYMMGITEVNPLPPHYVCPNCLHSDFDVDTDRYDCGVDLPDARCPVCGSVYRKDGFNIPFEVFLGIDADKVPDIDLNFSGEYQNAAHRYTEELFGKSQVFRAGTISGLQDKNIYGYIKHYEDDTGQKFCKAEIERLQNGLRGVKKTTGQHPGGMVIVPRGHEVYEYTAVQWPANESGSDFVTTHFDFNSMHDVLIKLDILGHDAPTIMRLIQDITGVDPLEIPLADPETLRLFSSIEPLGIRPEDLFGISKGTLGVPEFGTSFVRQMLEDTQPETVAEIVRICGLAHGKGVWLGNAQELIQSGICTLNEAICARDDIMNYLVARGVDKREAFFIMEKTRKGKIARGGFSDHETEIMKKADVPEWFLDACRKTTYLFPKGHAVAYCLMALRIAYCKVHHMEAFYATYFDVNTATFQASFVEEGLPGIRRKRQEIQGKGSNITDNEAKTCTILEVCAEMYLRGLRFLPVDLQKSDAVRFIVEDGGLRMPFVVIPSLGEKVARAIADERAKAPFLSVEDLRRRTKLSSSVAEYMNRNGALAGLTGRDQISLFDF